MGANATSIEIIAAACHEQNRVWCLAHGDASQPHWDEAPDWQRSSAMVGVKAALDGATPEESHQGWLELKQEEGWVYGPEKDIEKKTHPCMLPYSDLPEVQKQKDALFLSMVRQLGTLFGIYNEEKG